MPVQSLRTSCSAQRAKDLEGFGADELRNASERSCVSWAHFHARYKVTFTTLPIIDWISSQHSDLRFEHGISSNWLKSNANGRCCLSSPQLRNAGIQQTTVSKSPATVGLPRSNGTGLCYFSRCIGKCRVALDGVDVCVEFVKPAMSHDATARLFGCCSMNKPITMIYGSWHYI